MKFYKKTNHSKRSATVFSSYGKVSGVELIDNENGAIAIRVEGPVHQSVVLTPVQFSQLTDCIKMREELRK